MRFSPRSPRPKRPKIPCSAVTRFGVPCTARGTRLGPEGKPVCPIHDPADAGLRGRRRYVKGQPIGAALQHYRRFGPGDNKTMIKRLDALCREVVMLRDQFTCRKCGRGKRHGKRVEWSHVYSRRFLRIRWNLENSKVLCFRCHRWWHENPFEASRWWVSVVGEERLALLKASKEQKVPVDLQLTEIFLLQERAKMLARTAASADAGPYRGSSPPTSCEPPPVTAASVSGREAGSCTRADGPLAETPLETPTGAADQRLLPSQEPEAGASGRDA